MKNLLKSYTLSYITALILILVFVFIIGTFQKSQAQEPIIVPIANVFSPNSDGINDEFKINLNGIAISNYNMSIYANWGILVFNSNNPNVSWDGRTTSGLKTTEGTYFYVLSCNGKQYNGTLTLLY